MRQGNLVDEGRTGDDVAGAIDYLATAPWVTGEVIVVDGGRFLR